MEPVESHTQNPCFYMETIYNVLGLGQTMSRGRKATEWSGGSRWGAPRERLTELPVLLREKPHTSATARENLRDAPVIRR